MGLAENQEKMPVPQRMAVVAHQYGAPETFGIEPFDPGPPAPGEVRVAVQAAGISFVDTLTAAGSYQSRPPLPFIPGNEIAGVVEQVGEGVDAALIGRPILGTSMQGALAQAVNIDATRLWPMPDTMDFETGAAFRVGLVTAYHGLVQRAALRAGETILVLGASGTVGLAAVQLGKALGARVIASASTPAKLAFAIRHGADAGVLSGDSDWRATVLAASDEQPVDVVVDPVGGAMTEPAFRSLNWNGRHLMIGFAAGDIPRLPTNLAIMKGAALIGVNVGRLFMMEPHVYRGHVESLFELYRTVGLAPVIGMRVPLRDFARAMTAAGTGEVAGRIVVNVADG